MKKKLKLDELSIQSFITTQKHLGGSLTGQETYNCSIHACPSVPAENCPTTDHACPTVQVACPTNPVAKCLVISNQTKIQLNCLVNTLDCNTQYCPPPQ